MRIRNIVLSSLASCLSLMAGSYLVECEQMPHIRGMQLGSDWASSMSHFLINREKDNTVSGMYYVEESGSYNFAIRVKHACNVSLIIDGKFIGTAETTVSDGAYKWVAFSQKAELASGEHLISIADNADGYKHLDAIAFTTTNDTQDKYEKYNRLLSIEKREYTGKLKIMAVTDKMPVSYNCNEKIRFNISVYEDDKQLTKGNLLFISDSDYGKHESGIIQLNGLPSFYETTMDKPGFVRLRLTYLAENGDLAVSLDKNGMPSSPSYDGGAGADWENIPSVPEPDDFDAFWAAQKAKLDKVPLNAKAEKVAFENKDFDMYAVTIDCAGDKAVTGYFSIPKNAAPKSLKAVLMTQGYGLHIPGFTNCIPGAMSFTINAHGLPLGITKEEYAKIFAKLAGYALTEENDPEKSYFCGMALRVMRALQYLKSRPEWDGINLEATGGSQGGLQSVWAASLDEQVNRCTIRVPWGANLGGGTLDLMTPSWGLNYTPARNYYDIINHAKRIHCPVNIYDAGLGDYICPPSGISRFYHNLKCNKSIHWYQNAGHGTPNPIYGHWTLQDVPLKGDADWSLAQQVAPGIQILSFQLKEPRINKVEIARIDLTTPGLKLAVTPRAPEWGQKMPGFDDLIINSVRTTTRQFMLDNIAAGRKMVFGCNSTGWRPWQAPWNHKYGCALGFVVSEGTLVSDTKRGNWAFLNTKDGKYDFRVIQAGEDISNIQNAVAGYTLLVNNGEIVTKDNNAKHPRTGFGVSKDMRYFYVLIIDGRQQGYSEGATLLDMAELFKGCGNVWNAINMDGGGSTTLIYWDEQAKQLVKLNHHSGGAERSNGCNIGFYF